MYIYMYVYIYVCIYIYTYTCTYTITSEHDLNTPNLSTEEKAYKTRVKVGNGKYVCSRNHE